jgi:D-glycero-alpha-D-manno-heptose-7-phosphate kinase
VAVTPLSLPSDTIGDLERHLMFFYTGIMRRTSEVLSGQNEASQRNEKKVINSLHRIKEIGEDIKTVLELGDTRKFGKLLDLHWQVKKNLSAGVSNHNIDKWYEIAKENGALGGKIMGAGGGGFFMFYVEGNRNKLREAMLREGLREAQFKFEPEGSKVLANL